MSDIDKIRAQNEIIISLLGRIAFNEKKVKDIVIKNKKNPKNYLKGYNACDGTVPVNKIAEIVEVKGGTLSPILNEWEEKGILFSLEKGSKKFYKHLYLLAI